MFSIKLSINDKKFMVIHQNCQYLSINKVGKFGQILCAHLVPFRWPSHISSNAEYFANDKFDEVDAGLFICANG